MLGGKARFVLAIANDRHLLQGDQAAFGEFGKDRKEAVDFLLGVDDLHDHRQILRQAQYLRGVKHARPAKTKGPAQHRGSRKMKLARLEDNRLIERLAVGLVILANENSQEGGLFRNLHLSISSSFAGPLRDFDST